jgi:hypothetical protein
MNVQARTTALYCATLAGLLMLSACGKNEQEANTPATAPAATAPAPVAPMPAATTPTPPASAPSPTSTAPAPPTTAGKSASVQPAQSDIKVAAVAIGSAVDASHAISKEQHHFAPTDQAIYASVTTVGNTDNAALSANWSYVDGKDQPFSTTTESVATNGPATTTFKVQNPNAWPQGQYKVVISLNGKPVAVENFEVSS